MQFLRSLLLLVGMLSLMGGLLELTAGPAPAPWEIWEHDLRQALAAGEVCPNRVHLGESYALLTRAGGLGRSS